MNDNPKILTDGTSGAVVPGRTAGPNGGLFRFRVQTILVPMDFSRGSEKALQYAAAFAQWSDARIILLHILPPQHAPLQKFDSTPNAWSLDMGFLTTEEQQLARLAKDLVGPGIPVNVFVRFGFPCSGILEVAGEMNVNLIVMATHAHAGLMHVLLGSVAGRVSRLAPCPVFVVREHEHEWRLAPAGSWPARPSTIAVP